MPTVPERQPQLTVVTAVHRNATGLQALHVSLLPALGAVQWVIQDSGQCEATQTWAANQDPTHIDFASAPDKGIYEAINFALGRVRTPYYLVAGSDDLLDPASLVTMACQIPSDVDILSCPVVIDGRRHQANHWCPGWVNVTGLISSHSVGTLIRTSLHDRFGLYDTRYRVLADALFIRRLQLAGRCFRVRTDPVMGHFGSSGLSRTARHRIAAESYAYNVECGSSRPVQAALYGLRCLINAGRARAGTGIASAR